MKKWTGPHWLRPQEPDEPTTYCKDEGCERPIFFRKHPGNNRPHPVDPEGGSHFATCPAAAKFRQPPPDRRQRGLDL